jgi:hypothetical protein
MVLVQNVQTTFESILAAIGGTLKLISMLAAMVSAIVYLMF